MNLSVESKIIAVLLIAFAAAFSIGCGKSGYSVEAETEPSNTPTSTAIRAVFLFNSEACQCERDRNQEAEAILERVLAREQDALRPERLDVAGNPVELERYEKLGKFGFMPVLLGLDQQGRVAAKVEGFFKEAQVEALLLSLQ